MDSDSQISELSHVEEKEEIPKARGRPAGKADSSHRYRRTTAEPVTIKLKIASMKLEAMKEHEALKLANKRPSRQPRPPPVSTERRLPKEIVSQISEEPVSSSPSQSIAQRESRASL